MVKGGKRKHEPEKKKYELGMDSENEGKYPNRGRRPKGAHQTGESNGAGGHSPPVLAGANNVKTST